jgi:cytochrome c biogenesis protein CcmG/thiol:disulfide interchange protein DsbE
MIRYLLPLSAFVALVALFAVGLRLDSRHVPSPLIDRPLPPFELPRLHEPGVSVRDSDLTGRAVLLNVWASWCVSCRVEHPLLVDLARNRGVPIYGLNYKDERADALRWLEQFGDPYVYSAFDRDGRVGIDFGVYGVPETYVIDADGIIRYKHIGPLTQAALEDRVLPLLRQLDTATPATGG